MKNRRSFLATFVSTFVLLSCSVQATTTTINLQEGWNLISVPLQPAENSIGSVLSNINGRYLAVYAFSGDQYQAFIPGESGNTLSSIDAGRGYWLYATQGASLTIEGSTPSRTVELREGWNLVGFNSTSSQTSSSALSSISGRYLAVYGYNTSSNSYQTYIPGEASDLERFEPGHGYWIYATQSITWTLPGSTPGPQPNPGDRQVGQWDRFEETITNSKNYSDPYNGVNLDVTYTAPDGKEIQFFGFYDGGQNWKIRFMPDKLGAWKYNARFSDGSPGKSGSFTCVASEIPGMISKDETNPMWFGYKGGNHVFVRSFHVGDRFFASNWPDSSRKAFLDWAGKQDYNMLSIASFFLNRNNSGRGQGWNTPKLWPLNAGEYTKMEAIMDDLARRRMLVYPFGGFLSKSSNFPTNATDQDRYIKYTIARIGAYWNLVFTIGGPEPVPSGWLSESAINRAAGVIHKLDPFDHLVGCHNSTGDDHFKNSPWSDYGIVQGAKTTNLASIHSYMLKNHTPTRPLYAQEVFWDGNDNMPSYSDTDLRKITYVISMAATSINFGQMTDTSTSGFSGSLDLKDVKQARHDIVKRAMDFFETVPFYRMSPHQDLTSNGFCLAQPGQLYLVYLPNGGSVDIKATGGPFNVQYINAANTSEKQSGGTTSNGSGLRAPGSGDWLVYLTQ
jgi:hypothetical protein